MYVFWVQFYDVVSKGKSLLCIWSMVYLLINLFKELSHESIALKLFLFLILFTGIMDAKKGSAVSDTLIVIGK